MEDFIVAHIAGCSDIITSVVQPYAKKGATWAQLKAACRGFGDYQACVLQRGFEFCKDSMNDTNLLNAVTNGSFSEYRWTCDTKCRDKVLILGVTGLNVALRYLQQRYARKSTSKTVLI